jgi:pimeloyl-ACP methyl ester carboxylesterase
MIPPLGRAGGAMKVEWNVKNRDRVSMADELSAFEHERLIHFERSGFVGASRWALDRDGRRTYMISRGDAPCPTVLIHGGMSHAGDWLPLAALLRGHVVIPDRPGCGLSYRIDYRGVDYRSAAADWVLDLVECIEAQRIDLVGNSMGGYFAMAFAIAHPERVRRIALLGAPVGLDRGGIPLFLRLWGNPIIGPVVGKIRITDPEVWRRQVFGGLVAHPEAVPREMLTMAIAAAAIPGAHIAAHSMLRKVMDMRGVRPSIMLRGEMAHLKVPTLFVWGDRDAYAPSSSGQSLARQMPHARLEIIADAGHMPQLDRPNAVADAITGHLSDAGQAMPEADGRDI